MYPPAVVEGSSRRDVMGFAFGEVSLGALFFFLSGEGSALCTIVIVAFFMCKSQYQNHADLLQSVAVVPSWERDIAAPLGMGRRSGGVRYDILVFWVLATECSILFGAVNVICRTTQSRGRYMYPPSAANGSFGGQGFAWRS